MAYVHLPSFHIGHSLMNDSVIVMAANCAGISGSQIFRTNDKPRYANGLTAICALAGASWVLAAVLNLYYFQRQRRAST